MKKLIKLSFGSTLLVFLLCFGLAYAESDPSKGAPATEVIRGTVIAVDQNNRIIQVGGTRIDMPPLGEINLKVGQRVNVFVYRKKGIAQFMGIQKAGQTPGTVGQ